MNEKILIVEDEPSMVNLLTMTLEASGYKIEAAGGAEEAFKKIQSSPPDLIILDLMLPKASGIDLLKALRKNAKLNRIPVIILSALSDVDHKVTGLEAGADEYLTKPIEARELVARVSNLLKRTSDLREVGQQEKSKIVSFIGAMGGVGTTTSVVHIAATLAQKMPKIYLLELRSVYSTLALMLGLEDYRHLGKLPLTEPDNINRASIQHAITKHPMGFSLVCTSPTPQEGIPLDDLCMSRILESLQAIAEIVFIDLPSEMNTANRAALGLSDLVVLVLEPTPIGLDTALAMIRELKGVVSSATLLSSLTVNRSAIASSLTASQIQEELGIPNLGSLPQAADVLSNAYKRSNLLINEQPNHMATGAYTTIGKEIAGLLKVEA